MRTKIICSQLQTLTHTARAPVRANPPHVKISGMQLEICWFLTQLTMAGTFFLQRNYCKFLYQGISFVLQNTVDDNCNFSLLFVRSLHSTHRVTQCPRTDLNKKSLPRLKTTTAWKLISHRSKISKNWNLPRWVPLHRFFKNWFLLMRKQLYNNYIQTHFT